MLQNSKVFIKKIKSLHLDAYSCFRRLCRLETPMLDHVRTTWFSLPLYDFFSSVSSDNVAMTTHTHQYLITSTQHGNDSTHSPTTLDHIHTTWQYTPLTRLAMPDAALPGAACAPSASVVAPVGPVAGLDVSPPASWSICARACVRVCGGVETVGVCVQEWGRGVCVWRIGESSTMWRTCECVSGE